MNNSKFYKNLLSDLHDGLYFVDTKRKITFWNKAAEAISGFTASEVIGSHCSDNILTHVDADGNNLCQGLCPLAASINDQKPRETEVFMHHKDGHRVPVSVRVSPMFDDNGNVIGGAELFTDISNQHAVRLRAQELEKLAYIDELTKLANRKYISKEITVRLAEYERYGVIFGILFFDVDSFKKINDSYGHQLGDSALKMIANTVLNYSRSFDVYGRWGGDEFIGIIKNITVDRLQELAERLRMLIENSYIILNSKEKFSITVSIGATVVTPTDSSDSIIERVDKLLYESKNSGKNRLTIK